MRIIGGEKFDTCRVNIGGSRTAKICKTDIS